MFRFFLIFYPRRDTCGRHFFKWSLHDSVILWVNVILHLKNSVRITDQRLHSPQSNNQLLVNYRCMCTWFIANISAQLLSVVKNTILPSFLFVFDIQTIYFRCGIPIANIRPFCFVKFVHRKRHPVR